MDLADNLIVALFAESIRQDLLERFFLGLEGDRCRRAEAGVNELGVKLLRIPGEIQDTVDIAAAVVEGREQESSHRSLEGDDTSYKMSSVLGVGKLPEKAGEKDPDRGSEKTDKITEQLANADLKDTGSEDTETEEM